MGAGSPWAMLWAKAATHHGRPFFGANGESWGMNVSYVGRYVGLVQSTIQNMSQLTIGVNLVPEAPEISTTEVLQCPVQLSPGKK